MDKKFPDGFLWGAATSAHQVEGNNKNDWTVWERENAERLAEEAKHRMQLWQLELFHEMLEPKNYISARATDHYDRFEKDFDIARSLGHNAHRFSIEWSRIEPKEGVFDEDEIEHYREVVAALHERDIEPFVTLWHWTVPVWFAEMGGWAHRKAPSYFTRYAAKMANTLGLEVKNWITLNEPMVYASHGYLNGTWPPGKRSLRLYLRVVHHLERAHRQAFNVVKIVNPAAGVGIAKHNVYFEAYGNRFINRLLKRGADWWWNHHFLHSVRKHVNFIGLNHYFHNRINYGFNKNENKRVSDMGWELYPEAIYYALRDLKRYRKPVLITENGLADAKDRKRADYMRDVLEQVHRAIRAGVDVRGYLHWSLLDNFEWDKGFWPRFGLVEVDYRNDLERRVRKSAKEYAEIIKANGLSL